MSRDVEDFLKDLWASRVSYIENCPVNPSGHVLGSSFIYLAFSFYNFLKTLDISSLSKNCW